MPNRVVHFEIHTDEPERAIEFYKKVFGWEFQKWENPGMEYWMVMTAPKDSKELGINGGLMKRKGPSPEENCAVAAYVCTIDVANFDEAHENILANGGTVALAKQALPGMAWLGYYKDTEQNIFGIFQTDENAK